MLKYQCCTLLLTINCYMLWGEINILGKIWKLITIKNVFLYCDVKEINM